MYKETILIVGPDSSGKSSSLLDIADKHPDSKVYMIDLENKLGKLLDGLYPDLDIEVEGCLNWDQLADAFNKAKQVLKAGDWLMIDGLDKAWDLVQADYEMKVNGITLSNRVEELRLGTSAPGIDKWGWCKTKHNKDFLDVATGRAPFHVAATAWAHPVSIEGVGQDKDITVQETTAMWQQAGFKPGGEKRNTQRFDTVFALNLKMAPVSYQIATMKDKVRPYIGNNKSSLWTKFDIEQGLWDTYVQACEDVKASGGRVILPA